MDTPPDSQRKAWARLSTLTSFVSRICFFKARCSDSDSVNGFIVIPPAFDFTRVRLGGVKKILSTYLVGTQRLRDRLRGAYQGRGIPPRTRGQGHSHPQAAIMHLFVSGGLKQPERSIILRGWHRPLLMRFDGGQN